MKVRALRGVCIGVNRHLRAGDPADLDAATVTFLKNIGAVEVVPEEEPKRVEPKVEPKPIELDLPSQAKPSKKEK